MKFIDPTSGKQISADARMGSSEQERRDAATAEQAAFAHCRYCHNLTCIAPNVKLAHASARN